MRTLSFSRKNWFFSILGNLNLLVWINIYVYKWVGNTFFRFWWNWARSWRNNLESFFFWQIFVDFVWNGRYKKNISNVFSIHIFFSNKILLRHHCSTATNLQMDVEQNIFLWTHLFVIMTILIDSNSFVWIENAVIFSGTWYDWKPDIKSERKEKMSRNFFSYERIHSSEFDKCVPKKNSNYFTKVAKILVYALAKKIFKGCQGIMWFQKRTYTSHFLS